MRPTQILKTLVLLAALGLSGCGTTQNAKFYTLSPMAAAEKKAPLDVTVYLNMVNLADYLDRPQIVTRTSANEVSISEFERWAEPLDDAIPRLVAENLSLLLGSPKIATVPWQGSVAPDYTVLFEVIGFDGSLGGDMVLHYMYAILDREGKKVFEAKRSAITEPTGGPGYGAMVSAGSRAVAAMSREIAEAIRTVHAK
jgi:uncharacterized lipoprotein YmbA